jgi:arginyl-tRNA synthetase
LKNLVDTWLRQALARLPDSLLPASGREVRIEVQRPKDPGRGDFASNLALRLASAARRDARSLAEAIKSALPADAALAKVEIAGAGFLNFFLSDSSYHGEIRGALLEGGEFGKSDSGQGRALTVEVASVDPEGPLHAGHARQAASGASIAALLEMAGYRVVRECRIVSASRALEPCAAAARGARADGRAAHLAALRRELSEFGVTFDAWGLGGSTAAPALLRGARERPAQRMAGERVTLSALRAQVGNDAIRLFCVLRASDQPLVFDLDLAATRSMDNPLYSLQYAHARIGSVQRQLKDRGLEFRAAQAAASLGLLAEPLERTLIRRVSAFREILEQSAHERAPHRLAHYLRSLAEDFHRYYAAHPLVVAEASLRDARVALASAVQVVIRNGLRLLGIAAPETV